MEARGDVEAGSIHFELQKTETQRHDDAEGASAAELGHAAAAHRDSITGTRERRESGTRERRESESGTRERRESESGTRERRESGSGSRPGHVRRPSDSGIPQLVRDSGPGSPQPKSILSQKSSISDVPDRVTSPAPGRNASARFALAGSDPSEAKKSVTSTRYLFFLYWD